MKKIMKLILLLNTFSVLMFVLNSCSSPTDGNNNSGQDTTSSSFTWQKFTFGENAGSSSFYDVAIIDENNIWAVGGVYLDSANGKPDPFPYNAAHWDGNKWQLIKVPYYYQGIALYSPIYSILAFNSNDIWFGIGNLIHWNGIQYIPVEVGNSFTGLIRKFWGISGNDFYIVGDGGNIAHYNGSSWQKIESGTGLQLLDIYGAPSGIVPYQVLVVGSNNYPPGRTILSIFGNTATPLSTDPIPWDLYSIWFVPFKHYYLAGSGIYEKNSISDNLWKNDSPDITKHSTTRIRGNGLNDVFAVGSFGEVLHFNGKSWKSFINDTGLDNGSYSGLAVKGDLVVATGSNNQRAVILIGKR